MTHIERYQLALRELRQSIDNLPPSTPSELVEKIESRLKNFLALSRPERDPDPHGNWERS